MNEWKKRNYLNLSSDLLSDKFEMSSQAQTFLLSIVCSINKLPRYAHIFSLIFSKIHGEDLCRAVYHLHMVRFELFSRAEKSNEFWVASYLEKPLNTDSKLHLP